MEALGKIYNKLQKNHSRANGFIISFESKWIYYFIREQMDLLFHDSINRCYRFLVFF